MVLFFIPTDHADEVVRRHALRLYRGSWTQTFNVSHWHPPIWRKSHCLFPVDYDGLGRDFVKHHGDLLVILAGHRAGQDCFRTGRHEPHGDHAFINDLAILAKGQNPLPLFDRLDGQPAADLTHLLIPYPVIRNRDHLPIGKGVRHQNFPQMAFGIHRLFKSSANPLISLTRIKPMFNEYSIPLWSIRYIPIGRPFRAHEVLSHWRPAGLPQSNSTRNRFSGRCKTSTSVLRT